MENDTADLTIYRDERDLLDGQPHTQEFIISDEIGRTLLVKLTAEGEATLRQVNMRETTFLHLPADFLRAFVFQAYEWLCDGERWHYEQEVKAQQTNSGPTQDQEPVYTSVTYYPESDVTVAIGEETPYDPAHWPPEQRQREAADNAELHLDTRDEAMDREEESGYQPVAVRHLADSYGDGEDYVPADHRSHEYR